MIQARGKWQQNVQIEANEPGSQQLGYMGFMAKKKKVNFRPW